jgi:hypothetical protein
VGLTYTVQDAWDLANKAVAGTPLSTVNIRIADMVSSTMWTPYPWYRAITTIADGLIPLVDGYQDYSSPPNIYRLTKASLVNTTSTPYDSRELDVLQNNDQNKVSVSPYAIRSIALQPGVGLLRLESAVYIAANTTWEIRGEYQINPTKLTSLTDQLWFDDQYFPVFVAGVTYWAMKYANDGRAGTVQYTQGGKPTYTGQLAEFYGMISDMKVADDYGGVDSIFPESCMGSGRDEWNLNIFGES